MKNPTILHTPIILHIPIKREFFDMIYRGFKKEEYRRICPHWESRLFDNGGNLKKFDWIQFRNGYHKDARILIAKFEGLEIGTGKPEWGWTPEFGECYKIKIGEILERINF